MPLDPVSSGDISDPLSAYGRGKPRGQVRVFVITALVLALIVAGFVLYHRFDAAGMAARMAFHPPPTRSPP